MIERIKNNIIFQTLFPEKYKELNELSYWKWRKREEKELLGEHYQYFYTGHFGLAPDFYSHKRVLDIGCGPRGSLEWADMAAERVGLDPLANEYLKLGASQHKMRYVSGYSERIPFPDGYFDVVCSFNSLDHVSDLNLTIAEIIRVVNPGGLFLMLSDVNHAPTACEPIEFSWDVVESFRPHFELVAEAHYEKTKDGVYDSIRDGISYDHGNSTRRYGILSAKFQRVARPEKSPGLFIFPETPRATIKF